MQIVNLKLKVEYKTVRLDSRKSLTLKLLLLVQHNIQNNLVSLAHPCRA